MRVREERGDAASATASARCTRYLGLRRRGAAATTYQASPSATEAGAVSGLLPWPDDEAQPRRQHHQHHRLRPKANMWIFERRRSAVA